MIMPAGHAAPVRGEHELKAAYLYQFALFTSWPEEAFESDDAPIIIGVLGEYPFGKALDEIIQGRTASNRPLRTKRVRNLESLRKCHVLFICQSEKDKVPEILEKVKEKNILTVADMDGFMEQGGAISFLVKDKKVRFAVNVKSATQAGLKLSSKLLQVAVTVLGDKD